MSSRNKKALILLSIQSFFLGYAFALFYTCANTLFLVDFGAENLPYVYIIGAVVIPPVSWLFSQLQKKYPLSRVVWGTVLFFSVFFLFLWFAAMAAFDLTLPWLPFVLMIVNYLGILISTIVRGAQAGKIFDARSLKSYYPIIIGGQVLAIIFAGITIGPLIGLLGHSHDLILVSSISLMAAFLTILLTLRDYNINSVKNDLPKPKIRKKGSLLRNPYVAGIFMYQFFSAMGTRLVDYLYLEQTALRFHNAAEMTQFFGVFMALVTLLTLLFVLFFAGKVLVKFGMPMGLGGNPGGVLLAVIAAAVFSSFPGSDSGTYFFIIISAVALDFILTTGLTDTTIQSAYQPIKADKRVDVQSMVEGAGIPLAMGCSGLLILAVRRIPALSGKGMVFLTAGFCIIWLISGLLLNKKYRKQLIQSIRFRSLDDGDFLLKDKSSLKVLKTFEKSRNPMEVNIVLDILENFDRQGLCAMLQGILQEELEDGNEKRILCAVQRVETCQVHECAEAVEHIHKAALNSNRTTLCAWALKAMASLWAEPVEQLKPYLDNENEEIKLKAMAGMLLYGGIDGILEIGTQIRQLTDSAIKEERLFAARLFAAVRQPQFYHLLIPLLRDKEMEVRLTAISSAGVITNPRLWKAMLENLSDHRTCTAAMSALTAFGEDLLPNIAETLNRETSQDVLTRCIRLCVRIGGPRAQALLLSFHESCTGQSALLEIRTGLRNLGYTPDTPREITSWEAVVEKLFLQANRNLSWLSTLFFKEADTGSSTDRLLARALTYETSLLIRDLFLVLGFLYSDGSMMGAYQQLSSRQPETRALGLELLDISLKAAQKKRVLMLAKWWSQAVENNGYPVAGSRGRDNPSLRKEILGTTLLYKPEWLHATALYGYEDPEQNLYSKKETQQIMLTVEKVIILQSTDIFLYTPDYVLARIASIVHEVEIEKGVIFICQGQEGNCMYIIVEGKVRVFTGDREIAQLEKGATVGELSVLDPETRSADVAAMEDSLLFQIQKEDFDAILADYPDVASGVIKELCHRLRNNAQ